LPTQANRTIAELTTLTVTNTASDSSTPPSGLTYSLLSPPVGAAIDTNGVITWTPSEAQGPGTNTLTTVVTDNGAPPLSATNSFNVTVQEINTAPVLPAQTNRTILGLASLVVTNTATDTDLPANPLSYTLQAGPTNAVIDTNGVISWTPVVSQVPSTNVFTTVVTDFNSSAVNAQHLSATNSFTVVAQAVHNGPALAVQTNRTVAELTALVVTNKATDNDIPPRSLTYSLVNPPAGAAIDTNGVITWTPSEAQGPGTNTLTSVVTDNGAPPLSATNSFSVTVQEINTAPVLPAQTNRTIVGLASLVVTNTATDTDLPVNPLSYTLQVGPTNAVIDTNGVISWTPLVSQVPGTNVFTTVVTDFNSSAVNAQHLSATNSFTVVVQAIHNGPALAAQTNRTVAELTALVVTNNATDNDIPPRSLTYSLVNPPAGAAIDTNGVITWTPNEAQGPGTNTLTTVVTDNGAPPLSATNSFSVTVQEINTAPVLPTQSNRTILGLASLVVTNTAIDTDLPANPLSYTLPAGPTNAVIDTNGVITWTPVVSQVPSTNVFTTVVTDFNAFAVNAQHLSSTNSFTVVVQAVHNGPALAAQTNRTVAELTALVVTNNATDNDIPPRSLTYSLVNPPAGAAIDTNGVITWTPSEAQGPGTNTLTTVVTDNGAPPLSATNSFSVTVQEINTAPVLPAQTNRTIVGLATLVVTNTATDTDLPANPLSYTLQVGPTNAVIDTNGVIAWTPVVSQVPSTNVFTTVVTDFNAFAVYAQHLSATNSFTVVVQAVHNGPALAAQTNRTVAELTALVVTNNATDSDIPPRTLTYSLVNPPAGAAIDTNGVITWTPSEAQGPGTNTLTTVVTDNGAPPLSATNSFSVTVEEINTAPVLPAQTNRTIVGLATLVVTNTATDTDLPANPLSYILEAGPTNAVIDTNGVITWTPVVSQLPSTNVFTTVVTDFNSSAVNAQHLSSTNTFTVVAEEIHNGPALAAETNLTVAELTTLVVTNKATDNDIPPRSLTYSLVNAPAGATIATNGVITWTPSEAQGPGTYTLTTVVTDNGTPPLSSTNSFEVIVLEINTAPVLPAQTNRTIVGLATLVVTNTATDTDLPANPLSYVLEAGPTNAVIDTNGVITWTPIVSQVPSTNVFTTVVTDFNSSAVNAQHLSATNSFTVVVEAVHNGPVLAVETNRTVDELTTLVVTNHATANDIPSLTLTYSLVNPPAGAAIDTNGVITWTPSEAQGPGTNTLTTIVTDNGTPPLSATNSFEVTVLEINTAPFLPAQTNRTIVGLETLVVTNTATDTDLPANPLSYTLEAGPTNAVIDTNGVISWTPVVSQVPSTNVFMTVVTDFNSSAVNAQHLSATNSFTVVVEAIHNAPALGSQPNRTVAELTTLVVTNHATANDIPPLTLTYSLVNPPAGAAIDTNGVITWTPSETQGPGTNILTTVVTDNGAPPLSATNSFDVIVLRLNPSFESIIQVGPSVILTWNSLTGRTYRLQYSEDLASNIWTDLPPDTTAMSTSSSATNEIGASPQRFYRVILLP
jgi:hypothetical protein